MEKVHVVRHVPIYIVHVHVQCTCTCIIYNVCVQHNITFLVE